MHLFGRALTLVIAAAVLVLPVPALAAEKPGAERPSYSLGEKWVRGDGVYELIRIENDFYVFAARRGWEVHLTRDLVPAKIQKGDKVAEFNPPPKLAWPLEVGKWGVSSGIWLTPGRPSGLPASLTWRVDAYEDVIVSAGTFKAFRISMVIEPQRALRRWELQIWYAPEVRQWVKAEGHDLPMYTFEVVSVDRPVTGPLQLALEEPKEGGRLSSEAAVVAGKATSGKGVARVTITLNGQEVSSQDEKGAPKNEVVFKTPLKLREGRNVLLVTAADPEGTTQQEARTLFYDKPAPPAPPTPPRVAAPPAPTPAPEPPKVTPPPREPMPPVVAKPAPPATPAPAPPSAAPPAVAPPPFQVALAAPSKEQGRVEHASVPLVGVVSGGKGVRRVVVTLNGVEVSRLEERAPQPALPVNLALQLREGPNTIVVTATEADGAIYQEIRAIQYEKPLPLAVAFRYPPDGARVTEEASVVAAVVTSSKGVAKVSVTLNGAEVHQQSERTPQKSVAVTVPVKLREGANALMISASEPDGTVRQEIRTVIYDKPRLAAAPPTPPPPPAPVTRDLWAVVIGVARYENPDVPKLRYPVADAESLYQVLIGPAGFKKEHVLLMTDKTEKPPTLRNIKWALGTFLARSAKKEDTVLIYFAGHGAPEVDQRGVERDGLSKYLVPADADPDDLYSTALPMDELQTIFSRIEAERVVAFLDACYSGAAGGRTFASKKTRAGHVDDLFLERLARSKGRAIITAARPSEVSIELPELGHGIFTYYLVQGLKGAGDLNRDGIVSLQELYEYLEQQVARKSRAVGGNQHPVMKGELEGVLPLVRLGGR